MVCRTHIEQLLLSLNGHEVYDPEPDRVILICCYNLQKELILDF
jgi:hypothetical protein